MKDCKNKNENNKTNNETINRTKNEEKRTTINEQNNKNPIKKEKRINPTTK